MSEELPEKFVTESDQEVVDVMSTIRKMENLFSQEMERRGMDCAYYSLKIQIGFKDEPQNKSYKRIVYSHD